MIYSSLLFSRHSCLRRTAVPHELAHPVEQLQLLIVREQRRARQQCLGRLPCASVSSTSHSTSHSNQASLP
jgi:hypothetical protein